MGADLYMKDIHEAAEKKYRPLFDKAAEVRNAMVDPKLKTAAQEIVDHFYGAMYAEGYFRDSYNPTSILARLGLSWWKDVAEHFTTKNGTMSIANARKFLALIEPLPVQEVDAKWLKENHCTVDNGTNSVAEWNKSFHEHKAQLIAFLKLAIEKKKSIRCSL